MHKVSARELKELLVSDGELAVIDVREQGAFSESHLLYAVSIPLSRLELIVTDLVPRLDTRVVLIDAPADDDFAQPAAERLGALGYSNVAILDGGVGAWRDAGFELFSGVNVPSKAFGEFIEHTFDTPRLPAAGCCRSVPRPAAPADRPPGRWRCGCCRYPPPRGAPPHRTPRRAGR